MVKRGPDILYLVISVLAGALGGGLVVVLLGRAYTGSGMRLLGAAGGVAAVVAARLSRSP